ncbi:hypothetical protein [Nocardia pseudovaccinii]|uniref:hypothetical protein n=1 Tax=Nocardia pseudovaccinii TaxID=189540 RepID=UPI0012F49B23|nr:hypothetical protein [Nocardia pseudovaccinii]
MSPTQLDDFLVDHLAYEIRWLLRAASEWHAQNYMKLNEPGYQVQVYAADSTVLHARTLFEFFTKRTSFNYYGYNEYDIPLISSNSYESSWSGPIHIFMMHAQTRFNPPQNPITSFDGTCSKQLNEMPVDFAQEIVKMWREFIRHLRAHRDPHKQAMGVEADEILIAAINEAKQVLNNRFTRDRGIPPLTW